MTLGQYKKDFFFKRKTCKLRFHYDIFIYLIMSLHLALSTAHCPFSHSSHLLILVVPQIVNHIYTYIIKSGVHMAVFCLSCCPLISFLSPLKILYIREKTLDVCPSESFLFYNWIKLHCVYISNSSHSSAGGHQGWFLERLQGCLCCQTRQPVLDLHPMWWRREQMTTCIQRLAFL